MKNEEKKKGIGYWIVLVLLIVGILGAVVSRLPQELRPALPTRAPATATPVPTDTPTPSPTPEPTPTPRPIPTYTIMPDGSIYGSLRAMLDEDARIAGKQTATPSPEP